MSKRSIILKPENFLSLKPLTTVNIITIQPLELALSTLATTPNSIEVLLQGKPFEMVEYANVDNVDNVGKFTIDTSNNLVLIVDNTQIQTVREARNYIWGIAVFYQLKELTLADNIPTYVCQSFNSTGYQVSETVPSPLPDIMNKIKCLDNILDINETYYHHILTRNMI